MVGLTCSASYFYQLSFLFNNNKVEIILNENE